MSSDKKHSSISIKDFLSNEEGLHTESSLRDRVYDITDRNIK